MSDLNDAILNYVVRQVVADAGPCRVQDLRMHFQYVAGYDVIDRGLVVLTAKPAKVTVRTAPNGRYLTPTLEGWLGSDMAERARRALIGALLFLTGPDVGDLSTLPPSSYSWTNMLASKRVIANDYALVRSLIVESDLYNDACDPHALWTASQANSLVPPVDLIEITKVFRLSSIEGFLAYRRANPPALVRLKHSWEHALTPDRSVAMGFIYSTFSRTGKWPARRIVDAHLHQQGRAGLAEVSIECPFFVSLDDADGETRTKLTLVGLRHVDGSENEQREVIELLVEAGKLARNKPSARSIRLGDLAAGVGYFAQDEDRLDAFVVLLEAERCVSFTETEGAAPNYALDLSALPLAFADATTLDDIILACHVAPTGTGVLDRSPTLLAAVPAGQAPLTPSPPSPLAELGHEVDDATRQILAGPSLDPSTPGMFTSVTLALNTRLPEPDVAAALQRMQAVGYIRPRAGDGDIHYEVTPAGWRYREEFLHRENLRLPCLCEQESRDLESLCLAMVECQVIHNRRRVGVLGHGPWRKVSEMEVYLLRYPSAAIVAACDELVRKGLLTWKNGRDLRIVEITPRGQLHYQTTTQAELGLVEGQGILDRPPVATDALLSGAPSMPAGRFTDMVKLGEGVYGEVWRAQDTTLRRGVAIKFIRATGRPDKLALEHARALARVEHANIVKVYDLAHVVDPVSGELVPAVVMELVEGPTLAETLGRRLDVVQARRIGLALLDAMAEYHSHALAHADLHDDNVIVGANEVKVLDPLYFDTAMMGTTRSRQARQERDVREVRDLLVQVLHAGPVELGAAATFATDAPRSLHGMRARFIEVLDGTGQATSPGDGVPPPDTAAPPPAHELLAKLRGLQVTLHSRLESKRSQIFDPPRVEELFDRFSTIRTHLRLRAVFSDLPERPTPPASGTTDFQGRGYITRPHLENLLRDVEYCLEVLTSLTPGPGE